MSEQHENTTAAERRELTDEDIKTFARLEEAARLPGDTEHEAGCTCDACDEQVERAWAALEALKELRRLDAVGRLLAEVKALRSASALDRAAAREVLDAAERGTAAETQMALGNLRHLAASWSRGEAVTVADQALVQENVRLARENAELRAAMAASERDANALMDRLSEPAPSDKTAAERSVCVEQESGGKAVSLQSTPDNFIVLSRGLGDYDADIIAGSVQNILEAILSDHVAQIRAEQAADRAAARGLVEALPRCSGCHEQGVARPSLAGTRGIVDSEPVHGSCDEHAYRRDDEGFAPDEDVQWAAPLRALQARMAAWGEAAPAELSGAPAADPRWAAALEREANAFSRYKDPGARRDAEVLRRAAKLVRTEREARLILEALGWDTPGAVERVLRGEAPTTSRPSAPGGEACRGPLDSVLTEASRQVAAWPDYMRSDDVERRRREFDERLARLTAAAETIEVPALGTVEWMGQEGAADGAQSHDGERPPLAEGQTWRLPDGTEDRIMRDVSGGLVGVGPNRFDYFWDDAAPLDWVLVSGPGANGPLTRREPSSAPPAPARGERFREHARRCGDPGTSMLAMGGMPSGWPVPPEPDGDEETAYDVGAERSG